jgi:hypothetical protein
VGAQTDALVCAFLDDGGGGDGFAWQLQGVEAERREQLAAALHVVCSCPHDEKRSLSTGHTISYLYDHFAL